MRRPLVEQFYDQLSAARQARWDVLGWSETDLEQHQERRRVELQLGRQREAAQLKAFQAEEQAARKRA